MSGNQITQYAAIITYRRAGGDDSTQTIVITSKDTDLMESQYNDDFGEFFRQGLADDGDFDWLLDGDNNFTFELDITAILDNPEELKGFKYSNPINLFL